MIQLDRRRFLKTTLLAAGGMFLAPLAVSCRNEDFVKFAPAPKDLNLKNFDFGVASFDPTATSVIIWTRYEGNAELTWEIASDMQFTEVVRQGKITAQAVADFTVAIDVQDLPSNKKWYYRFYSVQNKDVSAIGETITLPSKTDAAADVKLAVVSCSNYPAGLFSVYKEIAKSNADVIVHLGDYIYEYAPGEYGTNEYTSKYNRAHKPAKELVALDDYRTRYRQYRSDKDLQLVHQKKPFICVWDDHEIANDTYKSGAENHQPNEGDFETRKRNAMQAYSEYIPLKTGKDARIYRSFDFGNLLSLHMLDTRVIARDKQLEYSDYIEATGFNQNKFVAGLMNPNRKILGDEQLGWLQQKLSGSTAKWQVLGQQVLMMKMLVPMEVIVLMGQVLGEIGALGSARPETMQLFQQTIKDLVSFKKRLLANDTTLTAQEKARVTTVLPYNLDAWDGYPVEREKLYAICAGKNIITLAGDTHNGWYGDLKDAKGQTVGKEIATTSVSSPGMEKYLGLTDAYAIEFAQVMQLLIDDLDYANLYQRGYLMATFSSANVKAEWQYINTVFAEAYTVNNGKTVTI